MIKSGLPLVAATSGAVALPMVAQLAVAIVGIGVVGMAHGAGDLAVVAPARRPAFLGLYMLLSLATMLWWTADPAVALPAFLVASAVHFAIEDAPEGDTVERLARGVAMIAAPATVHIDGYASLLATAGGAGSALPGCTPVLAIAGGAAAALLLVQAARRRDPRLAAGMAMLLLLPPLIGFTLGFLLLHAVPQTIERRNRLGCASTLAYLRRVAPVFIGALLLAGLVATLLLAVDPSGVRGLFAGIAALAVPHLLVTPWFETSVARPASRLAVTGR